MESKTTDKKLKPAPIYLNFDRLPPPVQARLLKLQNGDGEGLAFKTGGIVSSYILTAASILWLLLLFFLTDSYIWSNTKFVFLSLFTVIAVYLLVHNLYKIVRWFTSGSKSYLLITPLYVIDIKFNEVRYWNLEQLEGVRSAHQPQDGIYEFTQITLVLENEALTFVIKNRGIAEETIEQINYLRKLFIEASARGDKKFFESNDDLIELQDQDNLLHRPKGSRTLLPKIITASLSLILGAGIMFGAVLLNNYFDDKTSWNDAQTANHASSYRKYLQTHLNGRWKTGAAARLQTLYDEAEQKYRASLNQGFDPQAVDAVSQILRYARETQNYRVKVVFERHNEIPPDIVEELKKEYELKNLLSMGDAFSDEKMKLRENNLLTLISVAFGQAIPDDILEITSECADDCSIFLVKYSIDSDSFYYDTRQEAIPEGDRIYYPGIYIDWSFDVKTPNQTQTYNFELTSDPSKSISYDSVSSDEYDDKKDFAEVLKKDLVNVYDSMAKSAFDDFKAGLVFRMGIGEKPRPQFETDINTGTEDDKKPTVAPKTLKGGK